MVDALVALWRTRDEARRLARAGARRAASAAGKGKAGIQSKKSVQAGTAGGSSEQDEDAMGATAGAAPDARSSWPAVTTLDALRPLARQWLIDNRELYDRVLTCEILDLAEIISVLEAAATGARVCARLSKPTVCALLDAWGVSYQCKWK
ncbi:hypothetical protein T492DRAFT_1034748 [Pavlovales sp. CCMP2436]|nr:hypothetical protein T492DRAFT_1034748 [Pavlovales sp. CCMP2436]